MVVKKKQMKSEAFAELQHQRLLNWLYENYPDVIDEYEEEVGDERRIVYG